MPEAPAENIRDQTETSAKERWRARLFRFLDSGHTFSDDERALCYKHRFINTVFLVAWVVVSCFGLWRISTGDNLPVATLDLIFGAIALLLFVALRRTEKTAVDVFATIVLGMCLALFGTVYVVIVDAVRSGPFLLIIASAFFLKGQRIGVRWAGACVVLMLAVELLLPPPYSKGAYGTLASIVDIVCLILLLVLYESQKARDAEALRSNEEKFRTIFNSTSDAIFLIDDGRFTQWNAAAARLFRCRDDWFEGCGLGTLLAPGNPPELADALAAASRPGNAGGSEPMELLLRRDDGSQFYANIRIIPVTICGRPLHQAIVRNIDARKRSEFELASYRNELEQRVRERTQRLEESELRFSRLLELTEEGIFVHENRIIADVTNAFCRMTGYVKQELIGRDFLTLLLPPQEHEAVRHYIAAGGTHKYELSVVRADGSRIEVEAFGRAVDLAGRPLRAGVWRDVTARKETERKLEQARQAAEEATRAKSAFIANMSHEIRTPLNAIIGITRQLRRDTADAGLGERLGRVSSAARHLLTVLTDILDISKIEAGKLALEPQAFSFQRVVEGVSNLIRDSAALKRLDFRALTDERIPPVLVGDPVRLSQILINLASNAVKFTEQGTVTLWVSLVGTNEDGAALRFRVSDTGIGMSEELLSRLFRDFEQAELSTTRRYGGTGLGLSISRRLVELMGGEIHVRSAPGAGSDFWFEIRLPVSELAPGAVEAGTDETSAMLLRSRHEGARILLVEDAPINQEVALDLLHEAGLAADVADNGSIAVDKVRDGSYDLVLMDLQMPIMDGLAATRAIRALPGCDRLPIIAMTANAYAEDRAQCLRAGMNDYLAKPIEAPLLFAALARWLPAHGDSPHEVASPQHQTVEPDKAPIADDGERCRRIIERLAAHPGFAGVAQTALAQRKPARYLELLQQLFAEHGQDGIRLGSLLAANSPESIAEAQRLLHTLKGVAATFGLPDLMHAAARLHDALPDEAGAGALLAGSEALHADLNELAATLATEISETGQ